MVSVKIILGFILVNYCVSVSGFLIPDGIQKVNTNYGDIVGFVDQVNFDSQTYQVRKFLGIPYAEPPIGNLRFKKPVLKTRLPTPFKAQQFGALCPRATTDNLTMSENCLFLNIFTPADPSIGVELKPVMIWVHGGGFMIGSANQFECDVISAYNDVIVVTLNYRLGVLGFFSTYDDNAKGNYGLWDQHLAFQWVYENIGAFGGDNANITIFGESAGSSSVVYQMMYPGNEGIFKRVIAQSGTIAAFAVGNGNANYKSSVQFGRMLGCNDTSHSRLVYCIRQQNETDIIFALIKLQSGTYNEVNVSWVPVYDGEFVPAKTTEILHELANPSFDAKYNTFRSFDLLIGVNNFDGLVYLTSLLPGLQTSNPQDNSVSPYQVFGEHMTDFVIPRSLQSRLGETPTPLAVELTKSEYTAWNDSNNVSERTVYAAHLYTDCVFNVPMVTTARAHLNTKSRTYMFQFSNSPPVPSIKSLPHELDSPYVANHGDQLLFEFGFRLTQFASLDDSDKRVSSNDIKLSKAIMKLWTNFAKSGNPNFPNSIHHLYNVTWPEFDGTDEYYLEINDKMSSSSVKQRLAPRAMEFWNNILPKVQAFGKSHEAHSTIIA